MSARRTLLWGLALGSALGAAGSTAEAVASPALSVTRGPYLQMATPTSVVVRWRTDPPSDSCVRYGPDVSNSNSLACDPVPTAEHVVTVSGLSPNSRYFYSVGTAAGPLTGGDASYFFDTSPSPGAALPTRVWVLGDSGTADTNAFAVRDAYAAFGAGTRTNLMLMLGDNAYSTGTDAEYQAAVFDTYPAFLRNTVVWPTLGNHDGASADSASQSGPYYDIFTLPRNGEAGGLASGTEAYYSFDHGNIHFICLDSFETSRAPGGAMLTWLQQDALATSQQWIVAFRHHPPYTKGSHDSDTENELIDMRQNALPLLEQAGVDLVLTGHSHSYERSFLIDGHYGPSTTFNSSMKKDGGDGRVGGTGAYKKLPVGPTAHGGEVHVVAGSSGQISGGALNHPAMFLSLNQLGSLVLDINGRRLDATFVLSSGSVGDTFTLFKGPPPIANFSASATYGHAPLTVDFTDLSTGDPSSWAWDVDGQPGVDGTQRNDSHVYTEAGAYTVSLTASNLAGADTQTKQHFVCVAAADDLADADGDGIVDTCDPDDDNDGVADALDCAPLDATHSAPPGEVGTTMILGPSREAITWAAVPQATSYNVYRGEVAALGLTYNHTCLGASVGAPAALDTETPASGSWFYYLASAANSCGESSLGFDSAGLPRPNTAPCP